MMTLLIFAGVLTRSIISLRFCHSERTYLRLRRNNVFSTRNIIELSLTTRYKHVFFASSLGVFPEYFCSFGREFETSQIEDEAQPDIELMKRSFSARTDRLSLEQTGLGTGFVVRIRFLGMPLAIFRLPLTGMATNGYFNPSDIVVRLSAAGNPGSK